MKNTLTKGSGKDTPKQATPKQATPKANNAPKPRFGKDQPKNYCGKKGRSGPPKGSRNALRHGLKCGKCPADAQYIEHQVNALRRQLEDNVLAQHGEVTLSHASIIQTCCKWERHGALALRWLRLKVDELRPSELLQFSREIARASTERDRAIVALDLDAQPETIDLAGYLASGGNKQ